MMLNRSSPFQTDYRVIHITSIMFVVSLLISGCVAIPNTDVAQLYDGPTRSDDEIATVIATGISYGEFSSLGFSATHANSSIVAIQNKETGQIRRIPPTTIAKLLPGSYRIFVDSIVEGVNDQKWRNQLSVTESIESGRIYLINPFLGAITKQTLFGKEFNAIESVKLGVKFRELGSIRGMLDKAALRTPMPEMDESDMVESRWKIEYPAQKHPYSYQIVLKDRGRLANEHPDDHSTSDDRWSLNSDEIEIVINNGRLVLSGRLFDANHMAGYAHNLGQAWLWRATRVTEQ